MTHLDDVDLIGAASGLRSADDPAVRHLNRCPACQARAQSWQARLAGWTASTEPVPPLLRPRPPRRRFGRWAAVALAAVAFWIWPKVLWPAPAPWGPDGVAALAFGRTTALQRVSAPRGTVVLHWTRAGWALLVGRHLPPLPRDQVYVAWWIVHRQQRVEAAAFRPAPQGGVSVWLYSPRHFAGVTGVGVTREAWPPPAAPRGPREYYAELP
ncbi:MAG: hypothetical protein K6U14_00465 [Firmicutes bacterium]|nr:hypothetical protein [Alicyclobacillaceae bacterium]MCL6496094.1 hypothetical protein [Bacillota bacterium]